MALILSKETRECVRIGTLLRSPNEAYMVINIYEQGKGKCITVKLMEINDKKQECWIGHNIYGRPLSEYYGCEIVNYGIQEANK